jgi:hypothetical protein
MGIALRRLAHVDKFRRHVFQVQTIDPIAALLPSWRWPENAGSVRGHRGRRNQEGFIARLQLSRRLLHPSAFFPLPQGLERISAR